MSITESTVLNRALESAKDERKTGILHILASESGSSKNVKNAVLTFSSGELIGCAYLNKSGNEAVHALLQDVTLKIIFVRKDVSNYEPQTGVPSIAEILTDLQRGQYTESVAQGATHIALPVDTRNLSFTVDILATLIGEDLARLKIGEIMKHYANDVNDNRFIEACIALAASYVGDDTASAMFEEYTGSDN